MNKKYSLPVISFLLGFSIPALAQTKIIAHRGYWDCPGSAPNSLASLRKAQELKVYGSEFDVHLTADGIAVINHDDSIKGMAIESSTYEQLKAIPLDNGEPLPTLEQYLIQGKKSKATQLILEIKPHQSKEAEDKAVATVLSLVKKHNLEKQTEYISFSLNICRELIAKAPGTKVAYLKGELEPKALKEMGCTGLDYHYKIMQLHPEWIKAAHDLGLSVNVWTVNDPAVMQALLDQGVDYITTDKPLEMARLIRK